MGAMQLYGSYRGKSVITKDELAARFIHATEEVIAAEDTSYAEDDTEVAVQSYISGTFRESECISDGKLEADDIDTLRIRNIYLK